MFWAEEALLLLAVELRALGLWESLKEELRTVEFYTKRETHSYCTNKYFELVF